jgi:hypothetical protein
MRFSNLDGVVTNGTSATSDQYLLPPDRAIQRECPVRRECRYAKACTNFQRDAVRQSMHMLNTYGDVLRGSTQTPANLPIDNPNPLTHSVG